ncbi:hypothetical protein BJ742DRAFT_739938 [Cladochytrium replicatum]|nr:hypothetical protein BJ742DRAFT_739938 [Cladochytrium replicatum]
MSSCLLQPVIAANVLANSGSGRRLWELRRVCTAWRDASASALLSFLRFYATPINAGYFVPANRPAGVGDECVEWNDGFSLFSIFVYSPPSVVPAAADLNTRPLAWILTPVSVDPEHGVVTFEPHADHAFMSTEGIPADPGTRIVNPKDVSSNPAFLHVLFSGWTSHADSGGRHGSEREDLLFRYINMYHQGFEEEKERIYPLELPSNLDVNTNSAVRFTGDREFFIKYIVETEIEPSSAPIIRVRIMYLKATPFWLFGKQHQGFQANPVEDLATTDANIATNTLNTSLAPQNSPLDIFTSFTDGLTALYNFFSHGGQQSSRRPPSMEWANAIPVRDSTVTSLTSLLRPRQIYPNKFDQAIRAWTDSHGTVNDAMATIPASVVLGEPLWRFLDSKCEPSDIEQFLGDVRPDGSENSATAAYCHLRVLLEVELHRYGVAVGLLFKYSFARRFLRSAIDSGLGSGGDSRSGDDVASLAHEYARRIASAERFYQHQLENKSLRR